MRKNRKLKRDCVATIINDLDGVVGIYFADTDGKEVLAEFPLKVADKIIRLWNKDY